jgi:hypothetical protein
MQYVGRTFVTVFCSHEIRVRWRARGARVTFLPTFHYATVAPPEVTAEWSGLYEKDYIAALGSTATSAAESS